MALNNDTNFPPSGLAPYRIDRAWCLGDSLPYLNANFQNFDTRIDANTTAIAAASATIITTLSTVPFARLNDGNQTGNAPIYGCRAWVNFDALRNSSGGTDSLNTARFIRGQGNVSSVVRFGPGDYVIYFTIPMPNNNYCIFGSGLEDDGSNQPYHTTTISLARQVDISTTAVRILNSNIHPASPANYLVDGNTINVSVIC